MVTAVTGEAPGRFSDPLRSALGRLDRIKVWRLCLMLYLLALAVGVTMGFAYGYERVPADLESDELEYWQLSSQVLDGSFRLFPRRTAAYPLILAGLRLLSPGFLGVQILVTAIFALAAPMLFLLVRRLSGSVATGALAGIAMAMWPPTAFYGASLYSEAVALPLFLAGLLAIPPGSRAADRPMPLAGWAAVGAGVMLAATTQVRSMYLLFVPFALLAIVAEERRLALGLRRAALFLAGFVVATLPWSLYMSARFHHPIVITSNGGETLSGGLNPRLLQFGRDNRGGTARRQTWVGAGKWIPVPYNGYLSEEEMRTLPYDRQDALLSARTLAWVKANPRDAIHIELCKIAYLWGIYRMADNGTVQLLFGSVPIIALVLAAAAALAFTQGLWRRTPRLWVVPLFVTAVALISWGSWRFRQPADAALIGIVAIGLAAALNGPARAAPDRRAA